MKALSATRTLITFLATLGVTATVAAPALADDQRKSMEEIVVQAPISVDREQAHSASDPLVRTEIIELKREVYIGDLDLSRYEDVKEMEARIEKVAHDSCARLSDMFPLSNARSKDAKRCVERAIRSALAEKEQAIAAAK